MKSVPSVFLLVAVVLYIVLQGSAFIIHEYEQAILVQFGKPVGGPITQSGLYFKIPFIQEVKKFDNRILEWDGDPNQIPTKDKKYIRIDITARWKIVDVLKFYKTVRNETSAHARLDDVLDGEMRNIIAKSNLVEAVRNSNKLFDQQKQLGEARLPDQGVQRNQTVTIDHITRGREHLSEEIREAATTTIAEYGILLIDIKIKRVNYEDSVRQKVYDRMISERMRIAEEFRSIGLGSKSEILGKMEKELKRIESGALRLSEEIKGQADAEAARIYSKAYNSDPSFYGFLKTLETARKMISTDSTLLLSTNSDVLKVLKSYE